MRNIKTSIKGDKLIIKIDLSEKGELAASGNSYKIADTDNKFVPIEGCDRDLGLRLILTERVPPNERRKKTETKDEPPAKTEKKKDKKKDKKTKKD